MEILYFTTTYHFCKYLKFFAIRKYLLSFCVFVCSFTFTLPSFGQQGDKFAYAITGTQVNNNWNSLRKLNLQTGTFSDILFNGSEQKQIAFDAVTKKQISSFTNQKGTGFYTQPAFSSGVAAMALDKMHNRLYYTPMYIDQLRYIDLSTMKVYYVTDKEFSGRLQKSPDAGNVITRMVIAADGYGYAITNDGTQLLRFSTGKKILIEDLGTLADAQSNNGVSIHNSCSSYGGDAIADDDGNIYIFTARNYVFKINIENKIATNLGAITGLSNTFTINGAAVTDNNEVIVASANESGSYYTVDLKTLAAKTYTVKGTVWQSSDLANSNLYLSGNKPVVTFTESIKSPVANATINGRLMIFPNPVTNNQFVIQFHELDPGNYTVFVSDVMGRQLIQKAITISTDKQLQSFTFDRSNAKGIYMVTVNDKNNKAIFTTKLIVQ